MLLSPKPKRGTDVSYESQKHCLAIVASPVIRKGAGHRYLTVKYIHSLFQRFPCSSSFLSFSLASAHFQHFSKTEEVLIYTRRLQTLLPKGHKSYYTTVRVLDILSNVIVLCYILPNQQIFRIYIIFHH